MDTYSVSIQDHTAIDASVIRLYFTDTDNADWYVNYEPEYSDTYFYYNTATRMY